MKKYIVTTLLLTAVILTGCFHKSVVNENVNQSSNVSLTDEQIREELAFLFDGPLIASFEVSKYTNSYASGKAEVKESSGFWWMATNISGNWELIFKGQENIACSILEDFRVSVSFHPYNCFDDSGHEVLYSEYLKTN